MFRLPPNLPRPSWTTASNIKSGAPTLLEAEHLAQSYAYAFPDSMVNPALQVIIPQEVLNMPVPPGL